MDNKELEKIYEESYRAVYWTAMSLLKDEDEAQDIVQETYLALISSYSTLKDKEKVYGWLKKTAANKCLNRLTRTRTVNTGDDFLEAVEAQPEDFLPDSIIESDEKRKILMGIIESALSEDVRMTLILHYFDEMTTGEIATALDIPQGTVLWRLNFARKKIKKEVERYEKENNDRLYAMAIPFLTKLFTAEAAKVPLRPMPASLVSASASAKLLGKGAVKKVTAASKTAAKKGMSALSKKVAIGVVSVALAGAGTVAVVKNFKKEDPYRKALTTLMNDQVLPDGSVLELNGGTITEDCWFLIYDLNHDGIDDLIIEYNPQSNGLHSGTLGYHPDRVTYVFEYDPEEDSWELEFEGEGFGICPSNGSYGEELLCLGRFEDTHEIYDWYSLDESTHEFEYVGSVEEFKIDTYEGEFPSEYADEGVAYIIDFPGYDGGYCSYTYYDLNFYDVEIGESLRYMIIRWELTPEGIDECFEEMNLESK